MGVDTLEVNHREYVERVAWHQGTDGWVREASKLLDAVENRKGSLRRKRVLDFGCGTGRLSRLLHGSGAYVVGVDPSGEMLRRAEGYEVGLPSAGSIKYLKIVQDLPKRLGDFDMIFCTHVLGHTPDVTATLEMLSGSLADGGSIIVLNPNLTHTILRKPYNWLRGFKADPTIKHRFTLDGLRGHAWRAGMKVEWSYMTGPKFLGVHALMAASIIHA